MTTEGRASVLAVLSTAWELVWVKGLGRLLALVLILPIRVYQWTLSPLLAASCRYHPSCSRYAVDALRAHGPVKGLVLAGWRLLRCNPWSRGGLDPVPERGRWRPPIHPDGTPRQPDRTPPRPASGARPGAGIAGAELPGVPAVPRPDRVPAVRPTSTGAAASGAPGPARAGSGTPSQGA